MRYRYTPVIALKFLQNPVAGCLPEREFHESVNDSNSIRHPGMGHD
jgi:hypothetical protein